MRDIGAQPLSVSEILLRYSVLGYEIIGEDEIYWYIPSLVWLSLPT